MSHTIVCAECETPFRASYDLKSDEWAIECECKLFVPDSFGDFLPEDLTEDDVVYKA